MIKKIPYGGHYPSAGRYLIEEGISSTPKQYEKHLKWADGIDIVYSLKDLTPANFQKYSDTLLLLAYQEGMRYNAYKWKFAGFDVKLGRLAKGRDLPEVVTFQAAMHDDPEIMVYGEEALGYEVPQKFFLNDKVNEILEILKRYSGKLKSQKPFKVIRLFISIREENK